MTRLPLRLALALVGGLLAATAGRPAPAHAEGCAFPFTPTSYEDLKDRKLFTDTIELAAFNMLFPDDPYFGLPDLEFGPRNARQTEAGKIPTVLLKAIGWIESSITQAAGHVPFGSIGPALVSFDCGHGVAQVTSGMTVPAGEDGRGSPEQALVASHFAYNIARGAFILADKWNDAPEKRPISLPDLDSGVFEQALDLDNFIFPYVNMDIPTPQPFHVDAAEVPDGDLREAILGSPRLEISHERIKLDGGAALRRHRRARQHLQPGIRRPRLVRHTDRALAQGPPLRQRRRRRRAALRARRPLQPCRPHQHHGRRLSGAARRPHGLDPGPGPGHGPVDDHRGRDLEGYPPRRARRHPPLGRRLLY